MKELHRTRLWVLMAVFVLVLGVKYAHPLKLWVLGRETEASVYENYGEVVKLRLGEAFKNQGLSYPPSMLTLIVLKRERRLELWADGTWVKNFPMTGFSGKEGPKLRRGDLQIPEGCYRIVFLNPNSRFHLSLQVDYPNENDLRFAELDGRDPAELGGDIFIHGGSATVGCIPIGDRGIEELFILTHLVGKEKVEVLMAPYDFRRSKAPDVVSSPWLLEKYQGLEKRLVAFPIESPKKP